MRKVWKEIQGGREWIVDADLKDFFGSVDHVKLVTPVAQTIADGRVLHQRIEDGQKLLLPNLLVNGA